MDPTKHPLWDKQVEIEAHMADLGIEKFRRTVREAYHDGDASSSPGMRHLMDALITPTREAVDGFLDGARSGRPGRKHTAVKLLEGAESGMLAYITIRFIVDGFLRDRRMTSLAVLIGKAVELELRLDAFEKDNAALIRKVLSDLDQRTSHLGHKRAVVLHVLKKYGDKWSTWTPSERALVGTKLIELFVASTHVAKVVKQRQGRKTPFVVVLTPRFRDWLLSVDSQIEVLSPEFLPCVIPPKDWTAIDSGGYHTDAFVDPPLLVKTRDREHQKLLREADLSSVLEAVNAVQRTGWKVNRPVLDVIEQIMQAELDLPVIPPMNPLPIPEKPADIATNDKARTAWKWEASAIHSENTALTSKRVQFLQVVRTAQDFASYPAIYFPCQLDFRGRVYALPRHLHPQGSDMVKGLLTFAEGEPIEDESAAGWLAIHGANKYGEDKVPLDERVQWAFDHSDAVRSVAADPLANLWWTEADHPWQFLAWCIEWAAFLDEGYGFVSSLPISIDGTCNGLQHYSAMLRDPVGGAAVNLIPGEKPQDIYGEVAKVVMEKLETLGHPMACQWHSFGVDRTITKRPVMVLPYGGTLSACRKYVTEGVKDKIKSGTPSPFPEDELRPACNFLADVVWESIGDVVVAARSAMGWLQETARSVKGKPLVWTTPSGFPVRQAYTKMGIKTLDTKIHGTFVQLTLTHPMDKIDVKRQGQGIAPNFVHSMDAAALCLTVCLARNNGVRSFAVVHDSYSTTAAHLGMLSACTKHTFVDMYEAHDVLDEFRSSVAAASNALDLPAIPVSGGLDLRGVLESSYFFA